MADKRVLVVDDNPVNLKLTSTLIARTGCEIAGEASAEAALERIGSFRPLLIVTDIHLSGMDGLELARRVKEKREWRRIQIIVLTASPSAEEEARALAIGCECYLAKPVDARTFPGLVRSYLDRAAGPAPAGEAGTVESLRQEFLREGAAECLRLLGQLSESGPGAVQADWERMGKALHRWAGVGGTLGFPEITQKARAMEALIREAGLKDPGELRRHLGGLLELFQRPGAIG
ncbi:MAG TPA: response regulator [Bryobacteraceae bacterium]|nr:response regulator [Bryobacteraceae bacterium]